MKKIAMFFLLGILTQSTTAQVLKNIYRSDGAVHRIPIHLIDSVLVMNDYLRVVQLNGFVTEVPISLVDSITHNQGFAADPSLLGPLGIGSVMGIVVNEVGYPVAGALVKAAQGPQSTLTDINGVFFLDSISVFEQLGHVTIEKEGFFKSSKSFIPVSDGRNFVRIKLNPRIMIGSFSASVGGTLSMNSLSITFSANTIVKNGMPYNGEVKVYAVSFDPVSDDFHDRMPGALLGTQNDSLKLLRSFGMADVEITDALGDKVQIVAGSFATLTLGIPAALQSQAPTQIPFWSYDENFGYWTFENLATRVGNNYIGQASHFSPWNCDMGFFPSAVEIDCSDGEDRPISGARVSSNAWTVWNPFAYSNAEGKATLWVASQPNELHLELYCNPSNQWIMVNSLVVPTANPSETIEINGIYPNNFLVRGFVTDCEGNPVQDGYVLDNSGSIYFIHNGRYSFYACSLGQITLRAMSMVDGISLASDILTINIDNEENVVDTLTTCYSVFSTVVDQNGNLYPTAIIGAQEWMTENLRVVTFSNGDTVPFVLMNLDWMTLTTPGWSYMNNNSQNEYPFGKLYNWYAVADPRNLCPSGWHVPTDADWNDLIGFVDLTFNPNAINDYQSLTGGRTLISNSPQYWFDLYDVTNETGFSALPMGNRSADGAFYDTNSAAQWWSSSTATTGNGWFRKFNNTTFLYRYYSDKRSGMGVRCVKD